MEDKLQLSAEDVAKLEKIATEQYEYAKQYPHRKPKYRPTGTPIRCCICNSSNNLRASELNDGSKAYYCRECIMEEAKRLMQLELDKKKIVFDK